jgi:hypothetical protein
VSKVIFYSLLAITCTPVLLRNYVLGSENRLDGIQNFGRFGFFQTISDPSDGFPHRPKESCVRYWFSYRYSKSYVFREPYEWILKILLAA